MDRFNTFVDQFAQLHKREHSNEIETEEDAIVTNTNIDLPHMIHQSRSQTKKITESVRQTSNRAKTRMNAANKQKTMKM